METEETKHESLEQQYASVITSGGMYEEKLEYNFLSGAESLEFLHRISTNSLIDLPVNDARYTVLQTEKAKIIDLSIVIRKSDGIMVVTSKGKSEQIKLWLEKFIITEQIGIHDPAKEFSSISIIIPKEHSGSFLLENNFPATEDITIFSDPLWNNIKMHRIIGPKNVIGKKMNDLKIHFTPINERIFESLRMEQGIPVSGKELTEQVNPLEAGLESQISFSKGCYIGQEVIARIDTYKKLQKKIAGFIVDSPEITPALDGSAVFQSSHEIGWVTSSVWSYGLKRSIALGYIQKQAESAFVELKNPLYSNSIKAKISSLPFEIL